MSTQRYIFWQEGSFWLGSLEDFPDYMTQGETKEELEENLRDLFPVMSECSASEFFLGAGTQKNPSSLVP